MSLPACTVLSAIFSAGKVRFEGLMRGPHNAVALPKGGLINLLNDFKLF
jgi:hypothetical protein